MSLYCRITNNNICPNRKSKIMPEAYLDVQKSAESFFFHNFAVSDNEPHHGRMCPARHGARAMHADRLVRVSMMIISIRYIFLM